MCGIGIPKTIDNDLPYLDHTPGYGSAAKFIANVVSQIYFDDNSYINGRVNIIEIMGRNAGWLTASSSLATLNGAIIDMIYVPETPFNKSIGSLTGNTDGSSREPSKFGTKSTVSQSISANID